MAAPPAGGDQVRVTLGPATEAARVAGPAGKDGADTVTETAGDVDLPDRSSVATAVNWYVPVGTGVQVNVYGSDVRLASVVPFCRKSMRLMLPSGSDALAVS